MRGGKIGRHWAGRRKVTKVRELKIPIYYKEDGGCDRASKFLGSTQSHCLSCPFEKCKEK